LRHRFRSLSSPSPDGVLRSARNPCLIRAQTAPPGSHSPLRQAPSLTPSGATGLSPSVFGSRHGRHSLHRSCKHEGHSAVVAAAEPQLTQVSQQPLFVMAEQRLPTAYLPAPGPRTQSESGFRLSATSSRTPGLRRALIPVVSGLELPGVLRSARYPCIYALQGADSIAPRCVRRRR